MNTQKPIGIVGLGLMGQALAERLHGAGFPLLGFDIDAAKAEALKQKGGAAASSVADVAQGCDIIFVAVFDTPQVETVTEGDILPVAGDGSGKIVICVSTCDPDRIAALAARVAPRGLNFIEAPVSGTSEQVRRGQGVGLVAGDAQQIDKADPALKAVFPLYFRLGAPGNGGRAKLAINLILGLNRLALAEGLVFAERMGLEPGAFLDVARKAASYSQVMDTKGGKMVRGDFAPEGRARQTLKDVNLMLDQAKKLGQELPLANVNAQVLEACVRAGEGDADNSVVISEIRRRTKR